MQIFLQGLVFSPALSSGKTLPRVMGLVPPKMAIQSFP